MSEQIQAALEAATYGDMRGARVLEDEIQRRQLQDSYVLNLMRCLTGLSDFEIQEAWQRGSRVRGICTLDIFALMRTTSEQKAQAFTETIAEEECAAQQRAAMSTPPKTYPY